MDIHATIDYQNTLEQFSELAQSVHDEQSNNIHNRLTYSPSPTVEESALGAFMEMYEPHLVPMVMKFLKKGYLVEPQSGFSEEHPECQVLYGTFQLDERVVSKLGKIGVKVHKETNTKFIKFYPTEPNLTAILQTYKQIVTLLPIRTGDIEISQSVAAKKFRRTYIPQNSNLKHKRLFDILMYDVAARVSVDVQKRLAVNPKPNKIEANLGLFIEMVEPQVREAVVELHKKGYTTDSAGFMGKSDTQTIEGDFSIDDSVREQLQQENVTVLTNPSGYTRVQFTPQVPDYDHICKKWKSVTKLLPHQSEEPSPSMTARAREFRKKYFVKIST